MAARLRLFRWRAVGPLLLLLLALGIAWALFGDRLVERTAEEAGTDLLGTQVELAALRLRETEGAVEIRGLAIADPFDPTRNLIEAEGLRLELEPLALLEKKLVIRRFTLAEVRVGTRRTTPARPAPANGFAATTLRGLTAWRQQFDLPLLSLTPIDTLKQLVLDPTQLVTIQAAAALATRADSARQALTGRIATLDPRPVFDSTAALAQRLAASSPARLGLDGSRRAVQDVRRSLQALDSVQRSVTTLRTQVDAGLSELNAGLQSLDEARRRDYAFARGLLQLPQFEGPSLGNALFGPVSLDQLQQVAYWAELVQHYLPPGLQPRTHDGPQRLRRSGQTVRFPRQAAYPAFLLAQGELGLRLGGEGRPESRYTATVRDLTTAPALVGRPTRLAVTRRGAAPGALSLDLAAVLDHTGPAVRDSLAAGLRGLTLPSFALPGLPFRAEPGTGSSSLAVALHGDEIQARWTLRSDQVRWRPDSGRSRPLNRLESAVGTVLAGLTTLDVTAELSGSLRTPRLSVRSNVDRALADRLRALAGEQVARAEARARAAVDSLVDARVGPVREQVATTRAQLTTRVEDLRERVAVERAGLEAQLRRFTGGLSFP